MAKKDDPKKDDPKKIIRFDDELGIEEMHPDELLEQIRGIVDDINLENCDPGAPCYTLPEMLARKDIATLRKMAKIHGVKGYTKKDKSALVDALIERMWNGDELASFLAIMESHEWEFFCRVAKVKELVADDLLSDEYKHLLMAGVLALYSHKGHYHYVVPAEVKAMFHRLEQDGFTEAKDHMDLLVAYGIAAANLYGVILLDDLAAIFNGQNEDATDAEELSDTLRHFDFHGYGYMVRGTYLVDDDYEDEPFSELEAFARQAAEKTRYLPPKEEFLRYADWDYFERTPQTNALERYLRKILEGDGGNPFLVDELMDEMGLLARAGERMQAYTDLLEEHGVELATKEQAACLFELIREMHNHSRMAYNNGHTPAEIYKSGAKGAVVDLNVDKLPHVKEPGRNDPCPCGNGRKYKHCHGK